MENKTIRAECDSCGKVVSSNDEMLPMYWFGLERPQVTIQKRISETPLMVQRDYAITDNRALCFCSLPCLVAGIHKLSDELVFKAGELFIKK